MHRTSVSAAEAAVFHVLNGTTVLPVRRRLAGDAAGQRRSSCRRPRSLAAAFRRWRLAVELLVAGAGTYLLAKVVKGIGAARPAGGLLADVVIRGAEAHGRGFVSGHAATLAALATVAWPWLGRRGRIAVVVLVVVGLPQPGCTSARTCPWTSSAAPRSGSPSAGASGCCWAGPR